MPFSNAAMVTAANAIRTTYTYASTHTGDPSTTGANEGTATRVAFTWGAATNDGDFDISANIDFTDGGNAETATYVGIWDASSGGNWGGGWALSGDTAYNAAGEFTVTAITQNGSST